MKLTKLMTICGMAAALLLGGMVTARSFSIVNGVLLAMAQEKPDNKADQKPTPKPNRPPASQIDRTAGIARFLELTDDQKTKIKPILDRKIPRCAL